MAELNETKPDPLYQEEHMQLQTNQLGGIPGTCLGPKGEENH
jgi:hypothetical protein